MWPHKYAWLPAPDRYVSCHSYRTAVPGIVYQVLLKLAPSSPASKLACAGKLDSTTAAAAVAIVVTVVVAAVVVRLLYISAALD